MNSRPKYIKIKNLHLKRVFNIRIPDKYIIPFNIIMRKEGFSRASDFVKHIILSFIEQYIRDNPEIQNEIMKYNKLYEIYRKRGAI